MYIRKPVAADADAVAAISRRLYPERPEDAAYWARAALGETRPGLDFVADEPDTGAVVGYASARPDLHRFPDVRQFRLFLGTDPAWQGRGLGRLLYQTLMDAVQPLAPQALRARVRSERPETEAFLVRRGWAERQRMIFLEHRLDGLDRLPWHLVEHLSREGIKLTTLREEQERNADWLSAVHQLYNACAQDIPSMDAFVPVTLEEYARQLRDPRILPDCFFLAQEGGRLVGLSYLSRNEANPTKLDQWFTGVRRENRGRSVATALKLMTIRHAADHGYQRIGTGTLSINTGMLKVNEALGFKATYAELRMEKE